MTHHRTTLRRLTARGNALTRRLASAAAIALIVSGLAAGATTAAASASAASPVAVSHVITLNPGTPTNPDPCPIVTGVPGQGPGGGQCIGLNHPFISHPFTPQG